MYACLPLTPSSPPDATSASFPRREIRSTARHCAHVGPLVLASIIAKGGRPVCAVVRQLLLGMTL